MIVEHSWDVTLVGFMRGDKRNPLCLNRSGTPLHGSFPRCYCCFADGGLYVLLQKAQCPDVIFQSSKSLAQCEF